MKMEVLITHLMMTRDSFAVTYAKYQRRLKLHLS